MKEYPIEIYKLSDISEVNRKFFNSDNLGNVGYFYRNIGFITLEEVKKYKQLIENKNE